MLMIHGLNAIKRIPCEKSLFEIKAKEKHKYKRTTRTMSNAEMTANNKANLSLVVKMCVDKCSVNHIIEVTNVTRGFIFETKEKFGLIRQSRKRKVAQVEALIMNSEPYTHSLTSIEDITGVEKQVISDIIYRIPQIEKGTNKGNKRFYRYNYDIKVGAGATSCGVVK